MRPTWLSVPLLSAALVALAVVACSDDGASSSGGGGGGGGDGGTTSGGAGNDAGGADGALAADGSGVVPDTDGSAPGKCGYQGSLAALKEWKDLYPDQWRTDYSFAHTFGRPSATFEGFHLTDSHVYIQSDAVTLQNFVIDVTGAAALYPIRTDSREGGGRSIFRNGTITAKNATDDGPYKGVLVDVNDVTIANMEISGTHDGISIGSENVLVDTVCIHDLAKTPLAHNDGIEIYSGKNITIRNVTIDNANDQTSAINITNDFGPIDNVVIENSTLAGGGYTIYVRGDGGKAPAKVTNIHFRNVTITRPGTFGVLSDKDAADGIVEWDVKDATGKPIPR